MQDEENTQAHRTAYDDAYPTCERTLAELLIYPGDLEPRWITRRLGVEPTVTAIKGELKTNSMGRTRVVPKNRWQLSSEGKISSLDLRRHLDWLLDKVEPGRDGLLALQRAPGMRMGVNCIWWSAHAQGGPTLWPVQMRRLADLNLECGFDISFYGEDDDD